MKTTPERTTTQTIFGEIERGDVEVIQALLDSDPMLVHARHADAESHHWTTLQIAAARGKFQVCKLLVERGAEVYTNPMNTYPPVIQAAWEAHQEVVNYFLTEIPEKAEGTNRLGISIGLAARAGGRRSSDGISPPTHSASISAAGSATPPCTGRRTTITPRSSPCCWTRARTSRRMRQAATAASRCTGRVNTRRMPSPCSCVAGRMSTAATSKPTRTSSG